MKKKRNKKIFGIHSILKMGTKVKETRRDTHTSLQGGLRAESTEDFKRKRNFKAQAF